MLVAALLVGCAPVRYSVMTYPPPGKIPAAVEADKTDCEQWAKQESRADVATGVATGGLLGAGIGAGAGAVLGAILGAFIGRAGQGAAAGAAVGGASGAMEGAAAGGVSQRHLEMNAYGACMQGKGYTVKW